MNIFLLEGKSSSKSSTYVNATKQIFVRMRDTSDINSNSSYLLQHDRINLRMVLIVHQHKVMFTVTYSI